MGLPGRFLITSVLALSLCASAWAAKTDRVAPEAAKLLPEQIGSFVAAGAATPAMPDQIPRLFGEGSVVRTYVGNDGVRYSVEIKTTANDAEAFALLTDARLESTQLDRSQSSGDLRIAFDEIGTASLTIGPQVFFYKGNTFAAVGAPSDASTRQARELAVQLAAQLSAGEGEIPVLVKHLPQWETTSQRAFYFVDLTQLERTVAVLLGVMNQPRAGNSTTSAWRTFDTVSFDGGTEAVAATYGQSVLVIVEFTTPQMSIDNDSRIWTRIAELKSQGQPTPSAYRRVGNYSVFVFNAPDEKTANGLIDQVKYEQVVQWLGDDPHLYDRLQKYLTQTSAGVLIAVLKSSGLSLVLCIAVGGLLGALLFRHRRAQRAAAFSDAGGSIRLNLDELTGSANRRHLLSTSDGSHKDQGP